MEGQVIQTPADTDEMFWMQQFGEQDQDVLLQGLIKKPMLVLNSWSFCLIFVHAGLTGMCYHVLLRAEVFIQLQITYQPGLVAGI